MYEKVILICEAGNCSISLFQKINFYIQISIAAFIPSKTLFIMAINYDVVSVLANLAALFFLLEIDNVIGFMLQMGVNKRFPQLQMHNDFMKDSYKIKSLYIASSFTTIFISLGVAYTIM